MSITKGDHAEKSGSVQQRWNSQKWNYTIAFPGDWSRPRPAGPQILSPGVDVYSQNDTGSSTAVFCYAYHPLRDFEELSDQIVNNYKKRGGASVIRKDDSEKDARHYRTIEFKFGPRKRFTAYDTMVFCKNMQLVVSSNAPTTAFDKANPAFARIVDSLCFHSPDESLPVRTPNLWKSSEWGYSITFPKGWNDVKHGPFPDVLSADSCCDSWWGSSTFVFPYPRGESTTMNYIERSVMTNYQRRGRSFRIAESRDYEQNGNPHRTIIFEWTTTDRQEYVGHYTIVLGKEIALLISSQTKSRYFEVDKKEFNEIVGSAAFEENSSVGIGHT